MPELPEVEVTRRCLEPELTGRRITDVDVRRQRMLRRQAHPVDFANRLLGRRVDHLDRHGKFLLAHVSGDLTWVTHLGMSGRVATATTGDVEPAHTNVVIRFDTGGEFRLVDPRTFGFVAALTPAEVEASPLGRLGPDALSALPPSRQLGSVLAGRRAPIKALLLDQRVIAGLGNIYADEALHRAGIAPHRPAGDLASDEIVRLRAGIKATIDAGVRHGGTSLDDLAYLLPDGRAGQFVSRLRVYGRVGEPCPKCGTPIRRRILRQRSAHWCPRCQT